MTGGAVGVWYMALFAKEGFVHELYGAPGCQSDVKNIMSCSAGVAPISTSIQP